MKKIVLLFAVLSLVMVSCSSDSEDNNTNNPILVTQVTQVVEHNGTTQTVTMNFTYDGTKIANQTIVGTNEQINYSYDGNLISKREYIIDNELIEERYYTYNSNGKLTSYKNIDYGSSDPYQSIYTYTYNTNGTISFVNEQGYVSTNVTNSFTGMIYLNAEGLATKIENSYGLTTTYTYDDKNCPFKNVLGKLQLPFEENDAQQTLRNCLSEVRDYGIV